MPYRLGVDVGGTNTDAAILDDELNVVNTVKSHTTDDIQSGIFSAISKVLTSSKIDKKKIGYAMLGTTMSTNAIVERKGLDKVAYLRIGKPASVGVPAYMEWPKDLKKAVDQQSAIISGGYEYDGREISELNHLEVNKFCDDIRGKTNSIAIAGIFSPVNSSQEDQVAKWIKENLGNQVHISKSYQIGGIGLLERENATILNAALMTIGNKIVSGFEQALETVGIHAQTFFSQNDGTLMTSEFTKKYPIFTIGCGPTNSIRGAYHLSGIKNALVLDVGGTTSDIGALVNSFPRQSSMSSKVGGVETNFRMPDIMSIGIGGGTIVHKWKNKLQIGPDSVGYNIVNKAKIFGGDVETVSDDAAKLKRAFSNHYDLVKDIHEDWATNVIEKINQVIANALDQMKLKNINVPLILTGGGSFLIDNHIKGISKVYRPDHYDAANAVGAALGQVSGNINRIYNFGDRSRNEVLKSAKKEAKMKAISEGADPSSVEVVNLEIIPLAYLPGNSAQIRIKAVGNLNLT